jgi:hypothetical protein
MIFPYKESSIGYEIISFYSSINISGWISLYWQNIVIYTNNEIFDTLINTISYTNINLYKFIHFYWNLESTI